MKIVVLNVLPTGAFCVSREAILFMRNRGNKYALKEVIAGEMLPDLLVTLHESDTYLLHGIPRDDPDLLAAMSVLGEGAWGQQAILIRSYTPYEQYGIAEDELGVEEAVRQRYPRW